VKEIRGIEAVKYAGSRGLFFCIDETYLVQAEEKLTGQPVSMAEVEDALGEQLDEPFDPSSIVEGSKSFDFLLRRYGDGWIYVPLEGNHPDQEEEALLALFQSTGTLSNPFRNDDILDMIAKEFPKLEDTGFPKAATLNLVFHAALRLIEKGRLISLSEPSYYGNTRFSLPR